MTLKFRYFLLTFTLLLFSVCSAQDNGEALPLKKILEEIGRVHDIKLAFLEEDVRPFVLFPPPPALPLKAKLTYISNRTGLSYKETGNYIVIFTGPKLGIRKICGVVTDDSGAGIANAVVAYDKDRQITTGADGYFELLYTEVRNITIIMPGYIPISADKDNFGPDCSTFVLQLQPVMLEEIVADRYLTSGISKKKDGTFIIKPAQFGILPGLTEPDVLLAMQQLPGVNSVDETVSNINVRGGTHDQNLFMWNGIRLFQTGHFFGLISALNPMLTHDIKIAKNGTSAFYGESVSSAVDISSRSATIDSTLTRIGSNMINAGFTTHIRVSPKADVELSARRSFTDVIALPTYNRYSDRIFQNTVVTQLSNSADINYKSDKEFYFYDATGQYHQKIGNRNDVYLNFIGIKNKLDFTEGTVASANVLVRTSRLDQLTLGGTFAWRMRYNAADNAEIGAYTSYYALNATNASLESTSEVLQENKINDRGLRLANSNALNKLMRLNTGYQYNEISIDNSETSILFAVQQRQKSVLRTHALIGELEYNSENGKLFTKGGIRYNYIEQFAKFYPEPRLQVNFSPDNRWNLQLLGERKSQTASQVVQLQDDYLGIENRRWVLANNDNLPIQRSSQGSVGASYRNRGWLLSLDNFIKKVNGITTLGQSFQDQLEDVAANGSYIVYGTEFLIQKQFSGFYAWLSYTWNNNRYHFDGVSPSRFDSNFEIAHTVNSAIIYELYNFKLALGSRWYTGRPYTAAMSSEPVVTIPGFPSVSYDTVNARRNENFFQVNFSASHTWKIDKGVTLLTGVSVQNLFNRSNILNRYYRVNNAGNAVEEVNTYALARTPNARVLLSF